MSENVTVTTGATMTAQCSDASIAVGKILQGDTTNTTNVLQVVKAATASTQVPVGITITETDAANEKLTYQYSGIALVNVDGSGTAIDIGTLIVATTAGQGVAAPTFDATARYAVGVALAPSAASGDFIPVQLGLTHFAKGSS